MKIINNYGLFTIVSLLYIFGCSSGTMETENETIQYNLSIISSPTEGGTFSSVSGKYDEGLSINIQANASNGYLFKEWTGSIESEENPVMVAMDSDKNITAVFEEIIEECDQGIIQGDVWLKTQEEIDAFGLMCYSQVNGNLWLLNDIQNPANGTAVNDLSPLSSLRIIKGEIRIASGILEDLSGLENIISATGIRITSPSLVSFTGIESLIDETISSNIEDFSIYITSCDKITSLKIFDGIKSLKNLSIRQMESLESLEGLNSLEKVTQVLQFSFLPAMTSFNNLDNLKRVDTTVSLQNLNTFSSLSGLENLESVGQTVQIQSNSGLTSLEGIESLEGVVNILIRNNVSLSSLNGLNTAGSGITIDNNDSLTNLNGMNFGESSTLYLEISNCNGLTNLQGLEELIEVERLQILDNPELVSLSGIDNVSRVANFIAIQNNRQLRNFCALSNLFQSNGLSSWSVNGNLINPSFQDMNNGRCEQ
jgi:hypothetical protein